MPLASSTVLVTGATGFLAMNCILNLLEKGYHVRGVVRKMRRGEALRALLESYSERAAELELVQADLLDDAGWDEAMQGCQYVLHVASPFPAQEPAHEDELIRPAREGALRVLQAAARQGVQRVVLTSSIAAVSSGHAEKKRRFSEQDWSNLQGEISAYPKSKTLAEKAAWQFVESLAEDQKLELVVINPGFILGPVLDDEPRTSNELHLKLMRREVPGTARIKWGVVDVRDVAEAHSLALVTPQAAGKRLICVAESLWMHEIAAILQAHFAPQGYKIPTLKMPNFAVSLVGLFDKTVRSTLNLLDQDYEYDTELIRQTLGWQPRPIKESIVEMGESLIRVGLV
jgi:nucleoside-diphosphate-sugar epimerase